MQIYLVGGAVRDQLLHRPIKERDYVVVGATEEQMLDLGYRQVGKDFPVFLHPETAEEYALARTERKSGRGYTGFICHAAPDVTLEQDLARRDLTVNAMALDNDGQLIDPFNGKQDLDNRILRHVSDAFVEDPLRVLRVARFAARYHHLGFGIANETLELMREIAQSGELAHLSAERVWKETANALSENHPDVFFETLRAVGALKDWFGELDALWGVPNPAKWHPEIDTGVHTMMVLSQAVSLSDSLAVRYAALVHDLGKAMTPPEHWPSHRGHETLGLKAIEVISDRLKVPNDCRDLALLTGEFHTHLHRAFELRPETVLKVLNRCDAWRKPERFEQMLIACEADARGRLHFETAPYPQADYFRDAFAAAQRVQAQPFVEQGIKGKDIRSAMDKARLKAIAEMKDKWQSISGIKA
ncbi:multifunctional CCA addition/repair protein [Aliiglaciecola sp. CAU 1673]|uniref:multifunctional CCA addition/repair protein n=1 Tax=Aliiglaciecola sp. CAU 1673 TaxID=3032595 RepID=UPI0023DA5609|nr:multifunctional CCA addition/repair protein [Aliiglaciecola sp. CAU 1673]MDF2177459.1 multifunctional CCA addition/repair protein [Aliiglaciecola sp. CAU 1673]